MKIFIIPDSFKGSLDSDEVATLIEAGVLRVFPQASIEKQAIADGGEGTVQTLVNSLSGKFYRDTVNDPLHRPVSAEWGVVGDTALIEMASANGLPLLKDSERNPLYTSTYGTGELISKALDRDVKTIFLGLGGSATNDAGIGMMQALGVRFFDSAGKELERGAQYIEMIDSFDESGCDPRLSQVKIVGLCDVQNPLLGELGATNVFGPQKGADEKIRTRLESSFTSMLETLDTRRGDTRAREVSTTLGAGAAGGLGFGLCYWLKGELKSGIETILDLVDFDKRIEGVDRILTGEGRIDGQSVLGKVAVGIAKRGERSSVPTVAVVGSLTEDAHKVFDHSIASIVCAIPKPMNLEEAIRESRQNIPDSVERAMRLINVGKKMNEGK